VKHSSGRASVFYTVLVKLFKRCKYLRIEKKNSKQKVLKFHFIRHFAVLFIEFFDDIHQVANNKLRPI